MNYAFPVLIHWPYMMVVQMHHPCWKIHIVAIPCLLAKFLQPGTSSFIFFLIIIGLELDSNWNIMQQVRINTQHGHTVHFTYDTWYLQILNSLKFFYVIISKLSQWKMDGKEINCFYSIFAKKLKSHSHFRCIKKHKIIPKSCCFSAIMLLSPKFCFIHISDFEFKLLLQHICKKEQ